MRNRAPIAWPIACLIVGLLCLTCRTQAAAAEDKGYSAAALYNSANAYARADKPGLAVLNYERARLLAPDDPDIDANLRFVRESSHVAPEPRGWIDRLVTIARPAVVAWLGVAGVVMMGAVMTSYTRARAESLIPLCKVGFLERPERLVLLIIGALSNRMAPALWVMEPSDQIFISHQSLPRSSRISPPMTFERPATKLRGWLFSD